MVLYRADGRQMSADDWQDPAMQTLTVALDGRQIPDTDGGTTGDRFLLLLNAHHEPVKFTVPPGPVAWEAVLTTGGPGDTPWITPKGTITLDARSLLLLRNAASPAPR
jgi:isoamylase